jgi:hypothetical protein
MLIGGDGMVVMMVMMMMRFSFILFTAAIFFVVKAAIGKYARVLGSELELVAATTVWHTFIVRVRPIGI